MEPLVIFSIISRNRWLLDLRTAGNRERRKERQVKREGRERGKTGRERRKERAGKKRN